MWNDLVSKKLHPESDYDLIWKHLSPEERKAHYDEIISAGK